MNTTPHDDDPLPPFPSEHDWLDATWLDATLPADAELPQPDFVDRVTRALAEERALDRDLDAVDRELPRIVIAAYEAPVPAADFVKRTLAAAAADRRARWQQLLARHIAPTPSPAFVQRTLRALAHDRRDGEAAAVSPRRPSLARGVLAWPLLAAAAGLALWWATGEATKHPAFAPRAAAVAFDNRSGALWTALADGGDARALPHLPPDGIQLAFGEVR